MFVGGKSIVENFVCVRPNWISTLLEKEALVDSWPLCMVGLSRNVCNGPPAPLFHISELEVLIVPNYLWLSDKVADPD